MSAADSAAGAGATLERRERFVERHIGPGPQDRAQMLRVLDLSSMEALLERAVPGAIRRARALSLPPARSESETLEALAALAGANRVLRSFIGMGYYGCHMPAVILRNVLENPAWYTAYTPYQPEISQGRLEALLTFQTMVTDLTGLDVANASMLDEPTAAAEAMALALRVTRSKSRRLLVAPDCHPQTIAVVRTRARPMGVEVLVADPETAIDAGEFFCVLLQYPGTTGEVRDWRALAQRARERGATVAVATDLLALCLLEAPGRMGADIAAGSAQRFGVPPGFGGPHAGFLAARAEYLRSLPGRLVGVSVDSAGAPALRLALQTREQHIRREKATSNICTAQVLLAVIAAMYAVYHGPEGLTAIARRTHRLTAVLAEGLRRLGAAVVTGRFFDTVTVASGERTGEWLRRATERGINLRRASDAAIGISLDETATTADLRNLWEIFGGPAAAALDPAELDAGTSDAIPASLRRTGALLAHPSFHRGRSETEMLRYLRSLADRDIALDRAMIPLGSCTMKLNATTEMIPVSWSGFAALHPFAPPEQAAGYHRLIADLEAWLAEITGYDAVSLQPNAGSQGEFAGLLAIHAWHAARGDPHRDVCLIPSSAHGTNPASAHMAGMRVVVVACDDAGNVDLADLEAKAREHAASLAALMVTYPSTHGVFEPAIREICDIVHRHGGQVYMDGANLNAMVGIAAPGELGADVSHLNLHKTFCIPHGGGGPGVGPIAVRAHLAPYLPSRTLEESAPVGPVSGAPFGSAGILPIVWAYIAMMGAEGLTEATRVAILSANYVARRLSPHFPILYTGPGGMVAHECIIDLRPLKETSVISVDDVAKRLMDFGFHAPTMSFPVPGTLMIEPTESEPREELDRFCDAMIRIREEIRAVEEGVWPRDDNPLRNAPHTAAMLLAPEWKHPYGREQAAFPAPWVKPRKYWPPVARVDHVYGDRHVVCTCAPMSDYAEQPPGGST
ncbi:MAG: aminomethyl-transferring glycine dehydrogenase [Burkholderiales bacterium]|nr:aminomethyl-transferring glycine dehydrogenase [Burkholderiales bacterium]